MGITVHSLYRVYGLIRFCCRIMVALSVFAVCSSCNTPVGILTAYQRCEVPGCNSWAKAKHGRCQFHGGENAVTIHWKKGETKKLYPDTNPWNIRNNIKQNKLPLVGLDSEPKLMWKIGIEWHWKGRTHCIYMLNRLRNNKNVKSSPL